MTGFGDAKSLRRSTYRQGILLSIRWFAEGGWGRKGVFSSWVFEGSIFFLLPSILAQLLSSDGFQYREIADATFSFSSLVILRILDIVKLLYRLSD